MGCRDLRTGELRALWSNLAHFTDFARMNGAFKGHIVTDLGRVIGKYNSNLDIDPEDYRRPKDKEAQRQDSLHPYWHISYCINQAELL